MNSVYKVIEGSDYYDGLSGFQNDANKLLEKGYTPLGGISVVRSDNGAKVYYQAFILNKTKS